jgi:hypothetical protein
VDVQRNGQILGPALVAGVSGLEALAAKVFVDASGDGCLAQAAGCAMLSRGPLGPLPPSLMYFVRELPEAIAPQLPAGWFQPVARKDDLPMTSTWPNGPNSKALKIKVPGFDAADTAGLTDLEIRARRRMWEVLDYYQRDCHGEKSAGSRGANSKCWHFDHCSPVIGLRETRRIAGDYVLTVDDLRAGRAFDDAVARGVFQLDGMRPDDEKRTYLLDHDAQVVPPYQVPFRALIARDAGNLLMAGRCFSADQLALSSARVMTTCAMLGQAAGAAAAWSAQRDCPPRMLDGCELRRYLEGRGARLEV